MEKILIVDDIKTNRKLLGMLLLNSRDCEVIEAVDGKEALEQFNIHHPDLVLMDINMPEMDGYQSATEIKKLAGGQYTPVIFVTALSAADSLALALDAGGDDFITKPVNIDVLTSKIMAHLRIRVLNQQLSEANTQLKKLNRNLVREQELIEHFFEGALQHSYLDKSLVQFHMSSMSVFNGDILLAQRGPDSCFYLLVGDFTGHGLTAAMGTLPVAMMFFKMSEEGVSLGHMVREFNCQLNKLMPASMFLAANVLRLNAQGTCLEIWAGGMPEHYCVSQRNQSVTTLRSQNMPLGILKDSDFEEATEELRVEHGDKLYMYSDGITEARNSSGEMFGKLRLSELMVSGDEELFTTILSKLKKFTGVTSQNDDITLLELTCGKVPLIS